jgi:cob(I)alamin adenosyltransferase
MLQKIFRSLRSTTGWRSHRHCTRRSDSGESSGCFIKTSFLDKGYVQVYTGDGRGKSASALGLAFRAIGRGLRVAMVLFGVPASSTDHDGNHDFRYPDLSQLVRMNKNHVTYLAGESAMDARQAERILGNVARMMSSLQYDLIMFLEIFEAMDAGLVNVETVVDLIRSKPEKVELLLTGRQAPRQILDLADLITEVKNIKDHRQDKGEPHPCDV